MHLILYILLPLVVASDVMNEGQNIRATSRPQRIQQRKAKVTSTTILTAPVAPIERTNEHAIGSDFVPRDIIKFELADAKVPDFASQQRYAQSSQTNKRPRQRKSRRQTNTEIIETKPSNDKSKSPSDQSGSDSRVLTISHAPPAGSAFDVQRTKTVKQLPISVQKAINHAIKQDYNIPFLDTIKYYFKDPTPKPKQFIGVDRLPSGAKLVSDSRIKQWWQPPPSLGKVSATTVKPIAVSSTFQNDYVAYPLLRAYPVQYSMNVASDLVNGVGFLYGDRVYSKPYTYQKNISPITTLTSADVRPVIEQKPHADDNIVNGVYRTTHNSILSTSPVVFPTSTETPRTQTFVKYYSAELPEEIPTNPDTGVPLSTNKNTINLIHKTVNELKKHNPHLNVVPKRLEKDELVVHVTPKPDYFSKATTVGPLTSSTSDSVHTFISHSGSKDFVTDKNLVYLNKAVGTVKKPHTFVTHVEPTYDDLESGYAFGYRVRDYHTGNDFGHTQKRMTDGTTMGEYKILMPDGRIQNVKYKADDNGYQADVSYNV